MSIKLSQLKQNEIRTKVSIGDDYITIFNPTVEVKTHIIELIRDAQKNGLEPEANEIFLLLLTSLTDIEVDMEDVMDIIASPSKEMIAVIGHLNSIIQDIIYEMLMEQKMSLAMIEKTIMGKELTDKVEQINSMVKEIESNTDKILS